VNIINLLAIGFCPVLRHLTWEYPSLVLRDGGKFVVIILSKQQSEARDIPRSLPQADFIVGLFYTVPMFL